MTISQQFCQIFSNIKGKVLENWRWFKVRSIYMDLLEHAQIVTIVMSHKMLTKELPLQKMVSVIRWTKSLIMQLSGNLFSSLLGKVVMASGCRWCMDSATWVFPLWCWSGYCYCWDSQINKYRTAPIIASNPGRTTQLLGGERLLSLVPFYNGGGSDLSSLK